MPRHLHIFCNVGINNMKFENNTYRAFLEISKNEIS